MRLLPPTSATNPDVILAPQVACWSSRASGDKLALRPATLGSAGEGPGLQTEVTFPQKSAIVNRVWLDPTNTNWNSGTPVAASMSHQGHFARLSTNWCAGFTEHFFRWASRCWSAA